MHAAFPLLSALDAIHSLDLSWEADSVLRMRNFIKKKEQAAAVHAALHNDISTCFLDKARE